MTEINSIEIPDEFVQCASDWAQGDDMLAAVSSSGGLYTGTNRPYSTDENRYYTDEEWYVSLWDSLASDIRSCLRCKLNPEDKDELTKFETFCEEISEKLKKEYNLEDSWVV